MSKTVGDKAVAELKAGTVMSKADLEAVTDAQVDDLKNKLVGMWDLTDAKWNLLDIFEYEGFDPDMVYRHLALVRKELVKGGYTDETFKDDLFMIIGLQVYKGNVTTTNFGSFTDEGKKAIKELFSSFHISLKHTDNKKTAATVTRIAACFPFQTCIIASKKARAFTGPFGSSRLPKCMLNSVFASMIPINLEITKMLKYAITCFSCDQSIVLKKGNTMTIKEDDRLNMIVEQDKFSTMALNSPVMTNENRCLAMVFLGIRDHRVIITEIVTKNKMDAADIADETKWNSDFDSIAAAAARA